jgi:hypothetical protein
MIEIVLLGVGWIVGLSGVAAAATASFLELGRPRWQPPRWALLWLVLTPACELQCGDPRGTRDDRGEATRARPAHHALQYEREGRG